MCGGICSSDAWTKMQMQMQHEFAIKITVQTFTRGHTNKIGSGEEYVTLQYAYTILPAIYVGEEGH